MPAIRPSVFRRTARSAAAAIATLVLAACGSAASTTAPSPPQSVPPRPTEIASAPVASEFGSPLPDTRPSSSAGLGFEFPADAVAGFYETEGLTCGAPTPSRTAAGWFVTTCQGPDGAGRPVTVGLITDDRGTLGAGFAAVTALPEEDVLEPTDALDTLSGFLGAMLGAERASPLLPWLAGHLGNEYDETAAGDTVVATYLESADDPTRIYLEVDGPDYLAAGPPD